MSGTSSTRAGRTAAAGLAAALSAAAAQAEGVLLGPSGLDRLREPATGEWRLVPFMPESPDPPPDDAQLIGVIDSGVLADHPQIAPFLAEARSFTDEPPEDGIGHGTLVALQAVSAGWRPEMATLREAGSPPGGARLLTAKVTELRNGAHVPVLAAVIAAIDWMEARGVRVVNLSLGFPEAAPAEGREALCRRIREAREIFFAVAGPNDPDLCVWPAECGDLPNAVVVGEAAVAADGGAGACRPPDILAPSGVATVDRAEHLAHRAGEAAAAGDLVAAEALLAESAALRETAPGRRAEADLAGRRGDWAASLEAARRAEALDPEDWQAPLMAAAALAELERDAEALAALERAEANGGGGHPGLHWLRFVAVYRLEDAAAAEAALAALAAVDPEGDLLARGTEAFEAWRGRPPRIPPAAE